MSMKNYAVLKLFFEQVTIPSVINQILAFLRLTKGKPVRLDENYSNQICYDSTYEELWCFVFNSLIYNLITVTSIQVQFNQDNLYLISAVGNLLKFELNLRSSNILSKLFNIPINEMEAEIKIFKHMPGVPSGTSSVYIYM